MSWIVHPLENLAAATETSCRPRGGDSGLVIVHELPKRLRVKLPLLRRPHLDLEHFASLIAHSVGIVSVRVRPGAQSVTIEYDGTSAVRRSVLQKLSAIMPC